MRTHTHACLPPPSLWSHNHFYIVLKLPPSLPDTKAVSPHVSCSQRTFHPHSLSVSNFTTNLYQSFIDSEYTSRYLRDRHNLILRVLGLYVHPYELLYLYDIASSTCTCISIDLYVYLYDIAYPHPYTIVFVSNFEYDL